MSRSPCAVAPICYAHLAATQMGQFMKFEDLSETSSSHGGLTSAGAVPVPQLPRLQENVCNSMFFCWGLCALCVSKMTVLKTWSVYSRSFRCGLTLLETLDHLFGMLLALYCGLVCYVYLLTCWSLVAYGFVLESLSWFWSMLLWNVWGAS